MHASTMENMRLCRDRYLDADFLADHEEFTVLDVGAANVNGSYADLFAEHPCRYLAADIEPAPGVDVVIDDPYHLPFADSSIDVVISGQMLEHCEFFWLSFDEMVRVVKPDGFIFLIAPSSGPIHRFPVDCYRFYPDAYAALAKYAGCSLIDSWHDERGPWNDLVGVFVKRDGEGSARRVAPLVRHGVANDDDRRGPWHAELARGSGTYLDVLADVHGLLEPDLYLEIGVARGASLRLARGRAVGVDPEPRLDDPLGSNATIVECDSDTFFAHGADELLGGHPDLVFIDGMHLFEYVLRDVVNTERRAAPTSVIVIDDIFPNHHRQAARRRETQVWTGDVWKIVSCLATHRPDLVLVPIDARPTGVLLVAGLDPGDDTLWRRYNAIVREHSAGGGRRPPRRVMRRSGAAPNVTAEVRRLLLMLRDLRTGGADAAEVRASVESWRATCDIDVSARARQLARLEQLGPRLVRRSRRRARRLLRERDRH